MNIALPLSHFHASPGPSFLNGTAMTSNFLPNPQVDQDRGTPWNKIGHEIRSPVQQDMRIQSSLSQQTGLQANLLNGYNAALLHAVQNARNSSSCKEIGNQADLGNATTSGIMQAQGTVAIVPNESFSYPASQTNTGTPSYPTERINPESSVNTGQQIIPSPAMNGGGPTCIMQIASRHNNPQPLALSSNPGAHLFASNLKDMTIPQAPLNPFPSTNTLPQTASANMVTAAAIEPEVGRQQILQFFGHNGNNKFNVSAQAPPPAQAFVQELVQAQQSNQIIGSLPNGSQTPQQQVSGGPDPVIQSIQNGVMLPGVTGHTANRAYVSECTGSPSGGQPLTMLQFENRNLPAAMMAGGGSMQNMGTGPSGQAMGAQPQCILNHGGRQNFAIGLPQFQTQNVTPSVQQPQQAGLLAPQSSGTHGNTGNQFIGIAPNGQPVVCTPCNVLPLIAARDGSFAENNITGNQQRNLMNESMANRFLSPSPGNQLFNPVNQPVQLPNPSHEVNHFRVQPQELNAQQLPQTNLQLAAVPSTSPGDSQIAQPNHLTPIHSGVIHSNPALSTPAEPGQTERRTLTEELNESQDKSIIAQDQLASLPKHSSGPETPDRRLDENESTAFNSQHRESQVPASTTSLFSDSFVDIDAAVASALRNQNSAHDVIRYDEEGLLSANMQEVEIPQLELPERANSPDENMEVDSADQPKESEKLPFDATSLATAIQDVTDAINTHLNHELEPNQAALNEDDRISPEGERGRDEVVQEHGAQKDSKTTRNNRPGSPSNRDSIPRGDNTAPRGKQDVEPQQQGPQEDSPEKREAWEAYLDYDWTKMSPSERRKRRSYICNCKRLRVTNRQIVKSVRKGEQPIEFRSLNEEEITELSKRYPRKSIKRDKKMRNRIVAQVCRDQKKKSREFLEKENKKLRSQNSLLLTQHARLQALQAVDAHLKGSSSLKRQLEKLQTTVRSLATKRGKDVGNVDESQK